MTPFPPKVVLLLVVALMWPADSLWATSGDPPTDSLAAIAARARARFGSPFKEEESAKVVLDILLMVHVNGARQLSTIHALRSSDGKIFLPAEDLRSWRLSVPEEGALVHQGQTYWPLEAVRGVTYHLDAGRQELFLEAQADAFDLLSIDGSHNRYSKPMPSPLGGFLNYDLSTRYQGSNTFLGGLFETAVFRGAWVLTSTFASSDFLTSREAQRLETTWTLDHPESRASWRVGDAVTIGGSLSRPVRFAGVQWATNFQIQPGYLTYPLPTVAGQSALPAVIDLYIDGALRLHQTTDAGPFELRNAPLLHGAGTLDLVVRDSAGREQRVSQPFYVSTSLLRKGLAEHALQAGFLREDFGVRSSSYGPFFASGSYRRGLTNRLTGQLFGEASEGHGQGGFGADWLWGRIGQFSIAAAASDSNGKSGQAGLLAFERRSRYFSLSARTEIRSDDFTQAGLVSEQSPQRISQINLGFRLPKIGSLSVGYFARDFVQRPAQGLISASFTQKLFKHYFVSLNALHSTGAEKNHSVTLSVTRSFGEDQVLGGRISAREGEVRSALQLQRSLPRGPGIGYRFVAENRGEGELLEADLSAQGRLGTASVRVGSNDGTFSAQLLVAGSLAWLDGSLMPSRSLDSGFALVKLGNDLSGIGISSDHQLIARTGRGGRAILPRLRSFERNRIQLNTTDLPMGAQVGHLGQEIVPYGRGGLVLDFGVDTRRTALVTLIGGDGSPIPVGARGRLSHGTVDLAVGYRGEIFVTGLRPTNQLRIEHLGKFCEVTFPAGDPSDPLPHMGPFICELSEN